MWNKYYRYRIRVEYRLKNDPNAIAWMMTTICVKKQNFIDTRRKITKTVGPQLISSIPKARLCNAEIVFEPTCYLGRW